MRAKPVTAALCAVALALVACRGPQVPVAADVAFEPGTTMYRIHQAGRLTVGVKTDQPGIGFKNLATGRYEGFDIRIATIVAAALGLEPDQIRFVPAVTQNRERLLTTGRVDIVVASYSITEERRRLVGQAGPYYETGQQLLVRARDEGAIHGPEDLRGRRVCSVAGSTSIAAIQRYQVRTVPFPTYTQCVQQLLNRSVDAVTTDRAILLLYQAQQPDRLRVVGPAFRAERYGIGYREGDLVFCTFLTRTLAAAIEDGTWAEAFEQTLGRAGVEPPRRPVLDPCRP